MKTYLCIEEPGELEEPLYLESGPTTAAPPQIGDIILVHEPQEKNYPSVTHDWPVRGRYRVTSRRYEVFDASGIGGDVEMTCTLEVELVP